VQENDLGGGQALPSWAGQNLESCCMDDFAGKSLGGEDRQVGCL
jgi:hypothetical protein